MKIGDDPNKCGIVPQPRKTVRVPRIYLLMKRRDDDGNRRWWQKGRAA